MTVMVFFLPCHGRYDHHREKERIIDGKQFVEDQTDGSVRSQVDKVDPVGADNAAPFGVAVAIALADHPFIGDPRFPGRIG